MHDVIEIVHVSINERKVKEKGYQLERNVGVNVGVVRLSPSPPSDSGGAPPPPVSISLSLSLAHSHKYTLSLSLSLSIVYASKYRSCPSTHPYIGALDLVHGECSIFQNP